MKKRVFSVLLIIALVIAGLWLARQQTTEIDSTGASDTTGTQSAGLVSLDETEDTGALQAEDEQTGAAESMLDENGAYTTVEDVSLYLEQYGTLPQNFMTKEEARDLGWSGGGLDAYSYGMCIGGDRFGNYEGLLPESSGRTYYECDIDTLHADDRGAKRIVFSSDGLIYYTDDHYESFTLLYGTP